MSGIAWAVAVVLALFGGLAELQAMEGGGVGGVGGGGVGLGGLPPSITEPGWPDSTNRNCYQSRRVRTKQGLQWRRVWVCRPPS